MLFPGSVSTEIEHKLSPFVMAILFSKSMTDVIVVQTRSQRFMSNRYTCVTEGSLHTREGTCDDQNIQDPYYARRQSHAHARFMHSL